MKQKIYVPDIECDSCTKLITRAFEKKQGIYNFYFTEDGVDVEFNKHTLSVNDLVQTITGLHFRASTQPFQRKSFKERYRHYKENKHKYTLESKVMQYTGGIFLLLILFEAIAYAIFLQKIPNFLSNYGWWILYLNISIATISVGIWHIYSYKTKVTCMVGMMIGMTIGMQTGMMVGAVMGATNGFFVGAMVGMLLGTAVGAITGYCCGVMGVMEGMMAGLMGGTMGPMITVMMFSDNVLWFMPFYIIINVTIVWGLSYMLYEEVVEGRKVVKKPIEFSTIASMAIIANFVLLMIILYGPKSALVGF